MKLFSISSLICLSLMTGCSDSSPGDGGGMAPHTHDPLFGGVLVELGNHEFNIEFVVEPTESQVAAYVLDGHASDFVRVSLDSFDVLLNPGPEQETITFEPVARRETGESEESTSNFRADLPGKYATNATPAKLQPLTIRGKNYGPISFTLEKGDE